MRFRPVSNTRCVYTRYIHTKCNSRIQIRSVLETGHNTEDLMPIRNELRVYRTPAKLNWSEQVDL